MKGYKRSAFNELTSSMRDYLEMVCKMEEEGEPIRVDSLTASLHVRPSSTSKMLDNLGKARCIDLKRYDSIMVTEKGYEEGRYLLRRHQVPQDFFYTLNHTEDELELVGRIEHFIDHRTITSMKQTLSFLQPKNDITGKIG